MYHYMISSEGKRVFKVGQVCTYTNRYDDSGGVLSSVNNWHRIQIYLPPPPPESRRVLSFSNLYSGIYLRDKGFGDYFNHAPAHSSLPISTTTSCRHNNALLTRCSSLREIFVSEQSFYIYFYFFSFFIHLFIHSYSFTSLDLIHI